MLSLCIEVMHSTDHQTYYAHSKQLCDDRHYKQLITEPSIFLSQSGDLQSAHDKLQTPCDGRNEVGFK